jgi:hypothetical protein
MHPTDATGCSPTLRSHPSLSARAGACWARMRGAGRVLGDRRVERPLRDAVACGPRAAPPLSCAACGFEAEHYFWQCPAASAGTYPPQRLEDLMNALPPANASEQSRVLVVGDAMLDRYWFGAVDRISPEAPVPVVRVHPEQGAGAARRRRERAWNVKSIGSHSSLLTTIGDDEHGRRSRPAREGRHRDLFSRDPRLTTTVKLRVIGRSQQLLRIDFEEEPDHEVLTAMQEPYERALQRRTSSVLRLRQGRLTHISRMIGMARDAGHRVLVDPKGSDYSRYQARR